jgi:hypothetical protein
LSGSTVNSPPFNYSSGSGAEERHHNDFEEVVEEEEVLDEGYVEPKQCIIISNVKQPDKCSYIIEVI